LTTQQAADLCGIHRTTYERQEAGKSRVSIAAYRLLLMHGGWLPGEFEGWGIRDNKLWSTEDVGFSPGEIRAIPILYALIAEYEQQLNIPRRQSTEYKNVVPFRRK
jgi:hypothetical protein